MSARCPTCQSPNPGLHPAVQFEGEVQVCVDPYHRKPEPATPANDFQVETYNRLAAQGPPYVGMDHAWASVFGLLPSPPATINAAHLERQRAWSFETFGPGDRQDGVIDHIKKELEEIAEAAGIEVLGEWVDVIILGLDGALRAGFAPQEIIDAVISKQAKNEARTWPDWRDSDGTTAIEHVR